MPKSWRWVSCVVATLVFVPALVVLPFRWWDPPYTPMMVLRRLETSASLEVRPVPLAEISLDLRRAVIAAEDARFLTHHGIDLAAVRAAITWNRRQEWKRLRGASTITMQCARSVFLWPDRTWMRKAVEVLLVPWLELLWGKRRILEVYLNVAEWGPGVFGAEAASLHWFGVSAQRLSPGQAALLAAMLPNPRRLDPAHPSPALRARAALVSRRATLVRLERLAGAAQAVQRSRCSKVARTRRRAWPVRWAGSSRSSIVEPSWEMRPAQWRCLGPNRARTPAKPVPSSRRRLAER